MTLRVCSGCLKILSIYNRLSSGRYLTALGTSWRTTSHETKRGQSSSTSSVEFTSVRYPDLERGPYSAVNDADVTFLERTLPGRVITDLGEVEAYNVDWLKTCKGAGQIVLRPKTTGEISEVLKYCNERCLAVVPQGGNTGLVGGSVPVFDEIVLSTQLMNNIISLDSLSGTLVCQAGCILENLENHVSDHNLTMPLDLGAKGSCQIGGNIATNAGGLRLLRYGSLHGNVLGIEVVLAGGEILDSLTTMRKDNTGYDMKQLFIGSEGTLGIITAASIACPQKPQAVSVAFVACENFQRVLDIFGKTKAMLGEILSAFEFMDAHTMLVATDNMKLTNPIKEAPFYALIETAGSNGEHDEEKLSNLLDALMNSSIIIDGTVATQPSKIQNIWALRERISEGLMHDGYCYKYDVSLPLNQFYGLVEEMRDRVSDVSIRTVGYGHVGDGNLHLNVTSKDFSYDVLNLIEPFIYDRVADYRGSVSAEHGLGFKKREFIYHSKSKTAVSLMHQMKSLLDPKGILNPYKLLPTK